MSIKRNAKSGDFKRALEALDSSGGYVEGTPKSIVTKLGFDGSWKEFKEYLGVPVVKTELGRYAVFSEAYDGQQPEDSPSNEIDPELYAMCASAYILGEGSHDKFDEYVGVYDEIDLITSALATQIDDSIAGIYLPYETEQGRDVELYTVERSLMYNSANGNFRIYGSTVLTYA